MKIKYSLLILAIVVPAVPTLAAAEDSLEMLGRVALFQDAAKQKQYREAAVHLHWILGHQPKQHVSTYVVGAEVLDELAKKEKDPEKKMNLVDSMLRVYDLRLRFCGDSSKVINRKALAAYRYLINGDNPQLVLALMDEAFRLNGTAVLDATLVPYMQSIAVTSIKKKNLSKEEILNRYDQIIDILDQKEKLARNDKKRVAVLSEYRADIDELLLRVVNIDCGFIHSYLEPSFRQNQNDLKLAKKIFGLLIDANCEKDSLWFMTGEFIFRNERTSGLAKHLGLGYWFQQEYEKAQRYLEESLKLSPSASDSADVHILLGSLKVQQNDRAGARAAYRLAVQTDPSHKEALEKIGDLYFNSFKDCAKEKSMADDRAVYLIAHDYYERAGNTVKMEMARKAFPSKEEIFLMNYYTGNTILVGCWINETTVVRTRD